MEKKIKDYLHLYIGCEVQVTPFHDIKYIGKLIGTDGYCQLSVVINGDHFSTERHISICKLLLRPLSDMTEEEKEWQQNQSKKSSGFFPSYTEIAELTKYLLSREFDLFHLIESGLALDKTKL